MILIHGKSIFREKGKDFSNEASGYANIDWKTTKPITCVITNQASSRSMSIGMWLEQSGLVLGNSSHYWMVNHWVHSQSLHGKWAIRSWLACYTMRGNDRALENTSIPRLPNVPDSRKEFCATLHNIIATLLDQHSTHSDTENYEAKRWK